MATYTFSALFLAIVTIVRANDLIFGENLNGKLIFQREFHSGPTKWQQLDNFTVNAPHLEIISKIEIQDLLPDKNGEAVIVAGGVGEKFVTIGMKSSAEPNPYSFHVSIQTIPETENDVFIRKYDRKNTFNFGYQKSSFEDRRYEDYDVEGGPGGRSVNFIYPLAVASLYWPTGLPRVSRNVTNDLSVIPLRKALLHYLR